MEQLHFPKLVGLLALGLLLTAGCKKANERSCWKAHGSNVQEQRDLTPFHRLDLADHIHVVITQGSPQQVVVEAGENVVPFVNTEVIDETLFLTDLNKCEWLRDYSKQITVHITVDSLTAIHNHGTADINTTNTLNPHHFTFTGIQGTGDAALTLDCDSVEVLIEAGPFNLNLRGNTDYLYAYHTGEGSIDARDLEGRIVHVNHSGIGRFTVQVTERLIAEIYSYGDVYYSGSPAEITLTEESTGRLFQE